MRTIKFRAWSEDCKTMISPENKAAARMDFLGNVYIGGIILKDVTLMQYTGLKDKNGKEIYEGDIVRLKMQDRSTRFSENPQYYYKNMAVEWYEGYNQLGFRLRNGKFHFWMNKKSSLSTMEAEIIGTIYENPDLLKEKAQA
jgi:uncharacterized phage protein (TIGR01671 family)